MARAWTLLMWCPYSLPKRCILWPYELSTFDPVASFEGLIFFWMVFVTKRIKCRFLGQRPVSQTHEARCWVWLTTSGILLFFVCLAGGSRWNSYKTCDSDHNKHILYSLSFLVFSSLDFWIINRNTWFFGLFFIGGLGPRCPGDVSSGPFSKFWPYFSGGNKEALVQADSVLGSVFSIWRDAAVKLKVGRLASGLDPPPRFKWRV